MHNLNLSLLHLKNIWKHINIYIYIHSILDFYFGYLFIFVHFLFWKLPRHGRAHLVTFSALPKGSGTGPPKCARLHLAKRLHRSLASARFSEIQWDDWDDFRLRTPTLKFTRQKSRWNKTIHWHYTIINIINYTITNRLSQLKDVERCWKMLKHGFVRHLHRIQSSGSTLDIAPWSAQCSQSALCRTVKYCCGDSNMFQTFHLRCGVWGPFWGTCCPQPEICCNVSMCHGLYDLPLAATVIHCGEGNECRSGLQNFIQCHMMDMMDMYSNVFCIFLYSCILKKNRHVPATLLCFSASTC